MFKRKNIDILLMKKQQRLYTEYLIAKEHYRRTGDGQFKYRHLGKELDRVQLALREISIVIEEESK